MPDWLFMIHDESQRGKQGIAPVAEMLDRARNQPQADLTEEQANYEVRKLLNKRTREHPSEDAKRLHSECLNDVFLDQIWPVIRTQYFDLQYYLDTELARVLGARSFSIEITRRTKSTDSIRKKLIRRIEEQKYFEGFEDILSALHDLVGFRIAVCAIRSGSICPIQTESKQKAAV